MFSATVFCLWFFFVFTGSSPLDSQKSSESLEESQSSSSALDSQESSESSGESQSNSYSDKTYHLVEDQKNWTDAKNHCMTHYKDLAVINNLQDLIQVLQITQNNVWIGLHRGPEWTWSDGEISAYFNWENGFSVGFDCVSYLSGKWRATDCLYKGAMPMCHKVTNESGIMKKTYVYHGVSGTWSDAFNACTKQRSKLASITSEEEQSKFNEKAQHGTHIWIGLRRYVWKWSSGELFQNLTLGLELLPDDNNITNKESCAKMTTINNIFKIENCSETYSFLCYSVTSSNTTQPTSSSVTPTVKQPSILTSEWPNTLSYNLTFIDQQKSWVEALRYCQDNHKTLVHILNSTVQDHVAQMLKDKIYQNGVWIGLERNMIITWAPWLWTGGPYVNYSRWSSNFPVDPICQYCGKLVGNGIEWVDAYCSEELPFICQG